MIHYPYPYPYPCPIDFAAAWHDCTAQDPHHRGDSAVDLAYWQSHAAGYDEHSHSPGHYEATLAAIRTLLQSNDMLLDMGAGAGRFSVPLAREVKQVTALDHARPMLDLIRQKAITQQITNIDLVEAAWEDAEIEPHDIVLAAWSLYRLPDILAGVRKLIAATKRTLIIVAGAGHSLHHDPLRYNIWPEHPDFDMPMHIYFQGVLWQAGVHAELQIINERRCLRAESPTILVRQLAPDYATAADLDRFAIALTPQLVQDKDGCSYEQVMPVGLLVWQA